MGFTTTIPICMSLNESSALALDLAAEDLATAQGDGQLIDALNANHRLWLRLSAIAHQCGWRFPDRKQAEFVMTTIHLACRSGSGDHALILADINRDLSSKLTHGRDLTSIRNRATLAWREMGRPLSLESWLMLEMERKAKFQLH